MMSNTILITGANRGIGLELARQYRARGDDVIALCRNSSSELDALGADVYTNVDITDDASVAQCASALAGKAVDVLINNAGLLTRETFDDMDFERMRRQYEVNALGPLRVTRALADNLQKGSKVGIVTSRVGSLADNSSGGNYGYRMSKAAANMAGVNLAHDLRARAIAVILLHPGYVRTGMTGGNGHIDAPEAAGGLIKRLDDLTLETSGTFWHGEGHELPW